MAPAVFEVQEETQEETPKEAVLVEESEDAKSDKNDIVGELPILEATPTESKIVSEETPAFVEDDVVIISHDDAKLEDVAEAEAAVKVSSPVKDEELEDAAVAVGSFFDSPEMVAEPLQSPGSNEVVTEIPAEAESRVPNIEDQEDVPTEAVSVRATEDLSQGYFENVDASDFGVPSSDSPVHLEIKDTGPVLESAERAEPPAALTVDGAVQEEAVGELTAAPKADTPTTGELYPQPSFEEISNEITAEGDSKSPDMTLEEPIEETKKELTSVQTKIEPGLFVDKSTGEITTPTDSDPTASIIAASVLGGATVIGGAAAIIAYSSKGKSTEEHVKDSTSSKQVNEEYIIEPAPQTTPSLVHGKPIPAADVKQVVEDANTTEAPAIVVSSPPASPIVGTSKEADGRTAEVIEPTPDVDFGGSTQKADERESGEIFSHPVWNQSITPFLHYSLENTADGVRNRLLVGSMPNSRPVSSGNDTVSTKHQKNLMRAFWNFFLLGWLGGFGRILGGLFGKSKKAQRNAN